MVTHTPFDGSSSPFSISLKQLDLATWIEIDETFDFQMQEKRRLYAELPDRVFVAEPETEAAQQEVFDLLRAHVLDAFPERFRQTPDSISIVGHPALSAADIASDAAAESGVAAGAGRPDPDAQG